MMALSKLIGRFYQRVFMTNDASHFFLLSTTCRSRSMLIVVFHHGKHGHSIDEFDAGVANCELAKITTVMDGVVLVVFCGLLRRESSK